MSSKSFLHFDNVSTPIFKEPKNDNEWNNVLQWVLKNRSQCARFVLDGINNNSNNSSLSSSIGSKGGIGGKTTILHKVITSKTISPSLRLTLVQTIISNDSRSASIVDSQVSLPLHVAVRNEAKVDDACRGKILSILIEIYSAALLITDLVGCTPLHITCEELPASDADVRKLILAAPNAARIWNSSGVLPVHIACSRSCQEDVLALLLDAYPDSIDVNAISGGTPLEILRDKGGSEAATNVLKSRLRGYKEELGGDLVEIYESDSGGKNATIVDITATENARSAREEMQQRESQKQHHRGSQRKKRQVHQQYEQQNNARMNNILHRQQQQQQYANSKLVIVDSDDDSSDNEVLVLGDSSEQRRQKISLEPYEKKQRIMDNNGNSAVDNHLSPATTTTTRQDTNESASHSMRNLTNVNANAHYEAALKAAQAHAHYQASLGLNPGYYAAAAAPGQRPFLFGGGYPQAAAAAALQPQGVPFAATATAAQPQQQPIPQSNAPSSILEEQKMRHQIEINNVKQSHAMVLNDIRRHLNRKTSQLDQSKTKVNQLKQELDELKALHKERQKEVVTQQKRKEQREQEEAKLLKELKVLKSQAEQNDTAHETLMQQLGAKFAEEIKTQKKLMEVEINALNQKQSQEISDCQIQSNQEKLKLEKLQEEQLNQKKTQLKDLVALFEHRQEQFTKIKTDTMDGSDIDRIQKEQRNNLHAQLMNEARRVLDPLRSTVKELEKRLLVMVMERQKRKDRMANSKKTLPDFYKNFMDHEPTAKLISLLKCNIAELEQNVDELRKKAVPPIACSSSNPSLIINATGSNNDGNGDKVDVVNVIQDEDMTDVLQNNAPLEEGEDTVDGITIYPRSSEESHSTVSESLPE